MSQLRAFRPAPIRPQSVSEKTRINACIDIACAMLGTCCMVSCSHLSGFAAQYVVDVPVSPYAKNVSLRRAAPMDMVTQGALRSGEFSYV